jgi:arabinogalactan endo-1,4-beta-galactosidase
VKKILLFVTFIAFTFLSFKCKKNSPSPNSGPDQRITYPWSKFVMGVDLSYVNQIEDFGGIYRDSGQVRDAFQIMRAHGANTVRVRLWHTPTEVGLRNNGKLYYDLYGTEKTIRRAKEAGMAVNLDVHYSDTWADPAHQETPAAWKGLSLAVLKDSVYNYTLAVLIYLKSKNLVPDMIQVGNETNNGMLWPVGKIENNDFANFAQLLNSGIKAVRDFSATSAIKPKIILHEAQLQTADFWLAGITAKGVTDYDILGLSHYVKWSTLPTMNDVTTKLRALKATSGKEVMIVETAYPWTGNNADTYGNIISAADGLAGYEVTPTGQLKYMKDLVQAIIDGGGNGIMNWEPAWITSRMNDGWGIGSAWENNAFFDFTGNTQPVITFMDFPYRF